MPGETHSVSGRVEIHSHVVPAHVDVIRAATEQAEQELRQGVPEATVRSQFTQAIEEQAPGWFQALKPILSNETIALLTILMFLMQLITFFGLDPASQDQDPPPPAPGITEEEMRQLFEEFVENEERQLPPVQPPDERHSNAEPPLLDA